MANTNLKVLVTASLNTVKSISEINKSIQEIQKHPSLEKLKLKLKFEIDSKSINQLNNFNINYNSTGLTNYLNQMKAIISAIPNFRAEAVKLIQEINNIGEGTNNTKNKMFDFDNVLKAIFNKQPGLNAAFSQMINFSKDGIGYVNELNKSLTELSIIYMKSQASVAKYGDKFHDMGMSMGILTEDLTIGAVKLARQGLSETEMISSMQTAVQYAKIANIDFASSAKILRASTNGMGVEATQAADVFLYMGDSSASSASKIGEAMINVGGIASSVGLEFEKVSSWIAAVSAKTNESAQTIGNSIKSIITRIQSLQENGSIQEDGTSVQHVSKALADVGIQLADSQGNFRNFGTVMDELGAKWNILGTRQKAYISTVMAGSSQQSQFLNLMNRYGDSVKLYEGALNSAGIAQQKFDLYQEGTEAKLNKLKNAWTGVYKSSFNSDGINNVISSLTSLATGIDNVIKSIGLMPTVSALATAGVMIFTKTGLNTMLGLLNITPIRLTQASLAINKFAYFMGLGANSSRIFTASLVGLTRAFLPLTIITGITYAISELIGAWSKTKEKANEFKKTNDDMVESWSKNKNEIESLIDQYETLSKIKSLNSQEQAKFVDVQNKINQLMPALTQRVDEQGNAHLRTTDAISKEIDYVKKLKKNYDELTLAKFDEEAKKTFVNIDDQIDKINQLKTPKNTYMPIFSGSMISNSGIYIPESEENTLLRQRELIQNERELGIVYNQIGELVKQKVNAYLEVESATKNLTDSDRKYLDTQINLRKNTLTSKEQLITFSNDITEVALKITNVKNAINSGSFNGLASASNALQESLIRIGYTTEDATKEVEKMLKEFSKSDGIDVFNEKLFVLSDLQTELASKLSEHKDTMTELSSAYEDLDNGQKLSFDTIIDLTKKYPELLLHLSNEEKQLELNKEGIELLMKAKNSEFKSSLFQMQLDLENHSKTLEKKLTNYGIEAGAVDKLAKAKEKLSSKNISYAEAVSLGTEISKIDETKKQIEGLKDLINTDWSTIFIKPSKTKSTVNKDSTKQEDLPKQEELTKELINSFNAEYDIRQKNIKALEEQIELAEKQKDYNNSIELTNKLLKEQQLSVTDLNTANDKLHSEANRIREKDENKNYDTESWFDQNGEKSVKFQEFRNSLKSGKEQDYVTQLFDTLYLLKHAWIDNTNKIKDMGAAAEDTLTKIGERTLKKVTVEIDKTSTAVKAYDDLMSISKDRLSLLKEGTEAYAKELENQTKILNDKMAAEILNQENIEKQMQTVGLTEEGWNELNGKLKDSILAQMGIATAMRSTNQELTNQVDKLGDEIVAIYKEMYGKQKEAAQAAHKEKMKLLDEELKKYDDLIKLKLKALDEEWSQEDYDKGLSKLQKERDEIQRQIDIKSMNNSLEGKAQRAELENQLTSKNEEIDKYQNDHDREQQKKNLEGLLEAKKDRVDAEKDELDKRQEEQDKYYDELINNERKFNKIKEDLAKGSTEQIKNDLDGFRNFATSSYNLIGNSISENLIDRIDDVRKNMDIVKPSIISNLSEIGETMNEKILKVLDEIISKFSKLGDMKYDNSPSQDFTAEEQNTIKKMKANSVKWANATTQTEKDAAFNENQKHGETLEYKGVYYNPSTGKWLKKGDIPLYETGGYTGDFQGVQLAGLHPQELVLNKTDTSIMFRMISMVRDFASNFKPTLPDFSKLMPKMQQISPVGLGDVYINIDTITGDRKGGEQALNVILKGLNAKGRSM